MNSIALPLMSPTSILSVWPPISPLETEMGWANSEITLSMVKQRLKHRPPVHINDSQIILGSWNMEYMWQAKANHFLDAYKEIVCRYHLLAVQEVSPKGLATISKACGYNYQVSRPNSRGQSVGFLIHPRFKISNVCEYSELMNVCGIPDLRPALRLDILDTLCQQALSIITVHLKSMRGGLAFTGHVRKKQLEELVAVLGDNENQTIIVGDFNCFLDTAQDIEPLLADGYRLNNPHNHTSTQCSGGRLDGLLHKNMPKHCRLGGYSICNFWRSSLLGRSLSDHGLLGWKLSLDLPDSNRK